MYLAIIEVFGVIVQIMMVGRSVMQAVIDSIGVATVFYTVHRFEVILNKIV